MASLPVQSSESSSDRENAKAIVRRLRDAGHIAYFAGGCVRDALLGLTPKDYDVATDAPPNRVRELFKNTQAVGAAFGVILVRQNHRMVEVATFRADLEYKDGRRPEGVRFTTAEEDAKRRDFTINGLFFDPIENRVIDYVGGQADLAARVLRAIGNPNERFAEDHLRLLRAVRFASRFNFAIEPATAAAISGCAAQLPRISPERIADELRRMLTPITRSNAWQILWRLGLMPPLMRFIPAVDDGGIFDPNRSLFLSLQPSEISFGLALATAVIDYRWQRANHPADVRPWLVKNEISKCVRAMRQTLKISNEESDDMEGTLAGAGAMLVETPISMATKKRFLAANTSANARSLLDALARVGLHVERVQSIQAELKILEAGEFAPLPLICGDDLLAAGAKPGPIFKRALHAVYDAQLEGTISHREEALAMALEIVSSNSQ